MTSVLSRVMALWENNKQNHGQKSPAVRHHTQALFHNAASVLSLHTTHQMFSAPLEKLIFTWKNSPRMSEPLWSTNSLPSHYAYTYTQRIMSLKTWQISECFFFSCFFPLSHWHKDSFRHNEQRNLISQSVISPPDQQLHEMTLLHKCHINHFWQHASAAAMMEEPPHPPIKTKILLPLSIL